MAAFFGFEVLSGDMSIDRAMVPMDGLVEACGVIGAFAMSGLGTLFPDRMFEEAS